MLRSLLILTCLTLCIVSSAHAATETYTLDKPHTQILFSVDHLGFSNSYGKFTDYNGIFTLDHGHLDHSSVDVSIKTGSVTMDDDAWNKAVMGEGYFDVAHYPVMTFKSTHVEQTGPDRADVTGNLTLLGVTRPVTLAVRLNKTGRHPFMEDYMAGLSADGSIKRSDFGMTGGLPLVGDTVTLHLEIEGKRVKQPGQEFYNQ